MVEGDNWFPEELVEMFIKIALTGFSWFCGYGTHYTTSEPQKNAGRFLRVNKRWNRITMGILFSDLTMLYYQHPDERIIPYITRTLLIPPRPQFVRRIAFLGRDFDYVFLPLTTNIRFLEFVGKSKEPFTFPLLPNLVELKLFGYIFYRKTLDKIFPLILKSRRLRRISFSIGNRVSTNLRCEHPLPFGSLTFRNLTTIRLDHRMRNFSPFQKCIDSIRFLRLKVWQIEDVKVASSFIDMCQSLHTLHIDFSFSTTIPNSKTGHIKIPDSLQVLVLLCSSFAHHIGSVVNNINGHINIRDFSFSGFQWISKNAYSLPNLESLIDKNEHLSSQPNGQPQHFSPPNLSIFLLDGLKLRFLVLFIPYLDESEPNYLILKKLSNRKPTVAIRLIMGRQKIESSVLAIGSVIQDFEILSLRFKFKFRETLEKILFKSFETCHVKILQIEGILNPLDSDLHFPHLRFMVFSTLTSEVHLSEFCIEKEADSIRVTDSWDSSSSRSLINEVAFRYGIWSNS